MNAGAALTVPSDPASAIAETLTSVGLIDQAGARRARQVAASTGESIVAVIHQLALADDARLVDALAARFGIRATAESEIPTSPVALPAISASFLRRAHLLPLGWSGGNLLVGVIDPTQSDGLAALAFAARCAAEPRLMSASMQKQAFDTLYGASAPDASEQDGTGTSPWADDTQRMRDLSSAGPAVRMVDLLMQQALDINASDIHIEPLPDRVRIRVRVDGALHTVREEPAHLAAPIAARLKVLAEMDIADRRSAQDGRVSLAAKGRPVDVRVSVVPSAYGETIALRLLRRDATLLNLDGLGFSARVRAILDQIMGLRRGLFLITGPTGSGKTTTLYAMIETLRTQTLKILSIEDPIEYFFPDITQVQVNEQAGLTFPTALRSFLRQDPDIILVGEIRDSETARIAVQAALTGHLVLATLHAVDAPGAVSRLAELGVDRYLIAATLCGAVSQRLVRKLCLHCRSARAPLAHERALLAPLVSQATIVQVGEASGCGQCRQTGYAGRIAVAEGFLSAPPLRDAMADASGAAFDAALKRSGFAPLLASAAQEAAAARIALAEIHALRLA